MSDAYRDFLASAFMLATIVILVLMVWFQRPYPHVMVVAVCLLVCQTAVMIEHLMAHHMEKTTGGGDGTN